MLRMDKYLHGAHQRNDAKNNQANGGCQHDLCDSCRPFRLDVQQNRNHESQEREQRCTKERQPCGKPCTFKSQMQEIEAAHANHHEDENDSECGRQNRKCSRKSQRRYAV